MGDEFYIILRGSQFWNKWRKGASFTLSDQEEANDKVNIIDNDGDGDDDDDVKATSQKQTLSPCNFVNKRLSSNNRPSSIKPPLSTKFEISARGA